MAIDWLSEQQLFGNKVEGITNNAVILGLLRRLQEDLSLLSITIPGYADSYASAILQIHPERHYMLLDEMQPQEGHARFLRERRMRVRARLNGVDIRFTGELREIGMERGIAFYNIPIPEVVYYGQRRNAYRAYVGRSIAVPVLLRDEDYKEVAKGPLLDISAGGLSALLRSNAGMAFEQEEIIPHCTISLPTDQEIETSLEVRGFSLTDRQLDFRLAGRFVNLEGSQQKFIEQFVAYLDRRSRKMALTR